MFYKEKLVYLNLVSVIFLFVFISVITIHYLNAFTDVLINISGIYPLFLLSVFHKMLRNTYKLEKI